MACWEHARDGAAGFIDGAISGVSFGLVETQIGATMLGADTNSMAYMAGNFAGNMVGGAVASATTAGLGSCAQVSRATRWAAKGLQFAGDVKDVWLAAGVVGNLRVAVAGGRVSWGGGSLLRAAGSRFTMRVPDQRGAQVT